MKPIDIIIAKLRRLDGDAANYVQQQYDAGNIYDFNIKNGQRAISWLFTWSEQPQGRVYWDKLHHKYRSLSDLTPKGNIL